MGSLHNGGDGEALCLTETQALQWGKSAFCSHVSPRYTGAHHVRCRPRQGRQSRVLGRSWDRYPQMTEKERRLYREHLLKILPEVPTFTAWLAKKDELPPDFDTFPKSNGLPDPLRFLDGRPVRSVQDWTARRAEIRQLFEAYVLGSFPPKPVLERAVLIDETRGNGYAIRTLRLEFGPAHTGVLRVQLVIPEGDGPHPVLISPHLAGWAPSLVRRGYISAGYAANDAMDDTTTLASIYPDYDFALLPRRAWCVGLVLDYLETLPRVDRRRIGMCGYSRDGKMALIAAALDERIGAVIAGSTGVGGVLPWRLSGERNAGEGIETTTRQFPSWFVPRLRFFAGREDRLPIDGNLLVALMAPRATLFEYGLNDEVSNCWGNEQAYRSARTVYQFLGHPERIGILRVPGFHGATNPEACLDWLDCQFGRSSRIWTTDLLFPWDFATWCATSHESVDLSSYPRRAQESPLVAHGGAIVSLADWEAKAADIRAAMTWMLGDAPPLMPPDRGHDAVGEETTEAVAVARLRARRTRDR